MFSERKIDDFKIGDEVKYVSGRYGDSPDDPLWDGIYLKEYQKGIITSISPNYTPRHSGYPIRVRWGNGRSNRYNSPDLALFNQFSALDELDELFEI